MDATYFWKEKIFLIFEIAFTILKIFENKRKVYDLNLSITD